jgi:homoserine O-succinyltransferase/O-acetyltransferase
MPLIIEGGRVPSRWPERGTPRPALSTDSRAKHPECLQLALINNMPDSALEDTELQFFELLDTASGDIPVVIKLYSLAGVPRTERGQRHLNSFYRDLSDLWNNRFDGVIITGTEPREPDLRDEPYWGLMANVFDWAERNTFSTVLSCLAAHACVLHCDGIPRHRLSDKLFGVFESAKTRDHALMDGAPSVLRFPHSRWNEVQESELAAAGYDVLTKSRSAGVDLFVKKKKESLFVHFQGHPEYGSQTLVKEYRRDIKRFLRGERETYPTMPHSYFDSSAVARLERLRERALSDRCEEIIESFPESVVSGLKNGWQSSAIGIYRNWLNFIVSCNVEARAFSTFTPAGRQRCQLPVNNETA